ncbi:hypothetical protein [Ligilactobacillus equi]
MADIEQRIKELEQEQDKLKQLRNMKIIDSIEYAERVIEIEKVISKLWRSLNG